MSDVAKGKIAGKGVDANPTVTNTIIVDAAFSDLKNLILAFQRRG